MTLTLVQGDTAPTLTGTVSADVTGATAIVVNIRRPDRSLLAKTPTITDEPTGAWSIDWETDDLNTSGTYFVEVEVTFASGKIQTFAVDSAGQATRFQAREQIA